MNTNRIRFGTHARAFGANGLRSLIPVKGNEAPAVPDWAHYGSEPPSDELIERWRLEYPDCGIGLVMDGRVVAVDIDICEDRFRSAGFTVKDAAREAPALSRNIQTLAFEMLGPTGFVRVGLPPKAMLFYRAADAVPTMAGGPVEFFCTAGSKQVVLGGFHPEAVDEYRWVSRCNPFTHRFDDLPRVTSQQVIDLRARSQELCESAGLQLQQRATSGNGSGRVSSGIVGDYMSEVLSLIGKAWLQDPREIAAEYFRNSVDGEKHYRMVAVCGALILRRFTDDEIIAALEPVYRAFVHDDPSMSRLRVCPPRMRAGMRSRGTMSPHWRRSMNGLAPSGQFAMPRKLISKPKPPTITIGLDTEYQFNAKTGLNDLLSYQAFVYNPDTGLTFSHIYKPKKNYRGKYPRLTLGEFLGLVLYEARKNRVIDDYPRSITLACHFARADLSMFADFHPTLKRKLAAVHGTYVTTNRRLPLRLSLPDGERRVSLSVVDTMLLSPQKTSLAMIGAQLGLPKLEIMPGYSIEEMERYRPEQPEAFDAYALRDAEIAARYVISIFDLFKKLGISGGKPTLGSAGVALFKLLFPNKETWLTFLGQDPGSNSRVWKPSPDALVVSGFTPGAYHGGLNSIYGVGYSPPGREVLDADIAAAYTTALAAIRCPDWASSREAKLLDDLAVVDGAMTFAQIKFRFSDETRFPCLPVRSKNQHGLIYPLEGESWCCGPELVVALSMGCSIKVLNGYRIEWIPGRVNPFATFARDIAAGRKAAKASGDAMLGLVYKLLGNTLYGKVSQGVGSKRPIRDDVEDHRIFDAEAGEMADLPPSSITCPSIAAWATSFVRAVMLEALHRLPPTAIALQATTDGILFVGAVSDINISGPVAKAFRRASALVTGADDPPIWEIKHCLPRVIPFKTRGMISVVPEGWTGQVHLAKAGAHFPDHLQTEVESTRYAEQLYRDRTYDTMYERKDLTSLSEQHKTGCDLTSKTKTVRLNWDFDFKNEPVEPVVDVEGVISFSTRPWRTVQDFERCRKDFEDWQRSQRRSLTTARDYFDFVEWVALRPARKILRTRSDGILPNLVRVIAAEAMRRPWPERPSYEQIAESLKRATGRAVTKHTINEIRRRRDLIPHQCLTMLSADDIEFARVYGTNAIAIEQLRSAIIPGSSAERQFADIWEKRLPAPAPALETDHINGFDYFRIFDDRRRLLVPNVGPDEARFRAIDFTVSFLRNKLDIDFETAKSTVLAALGAA